MEYHTGELAIQARAGVQAEAQGLRKGISTIVKPAAQDFLRNQQLAIASTIDSNEQVWASLLTGEPGFIQVVSDQLVQIHATLILGEPLEKNLNDQPEFGLLAIDLATRRRLRLNGQAEMQPDGMIQLQTQQVYFNCPKYIQMRHVETHLLPTDAASQVQSTETLTPAQQNWIAQADTFFIASFHPESGADASHRGGFPGFVRVVNSHQLVFPDYAGNNMFNTLGNLAVNPRSGLLFIDFERGHTLQLTGRAEIIWDADRTAEFVGAERLVAFEIDRVLAIANANSRHWQFVEYSPANPGRRDHRSVIA